MRRLLIVLAMAAAVPAAAQVPGAERPVRADSLPPLPDSLRIYGGTLAVRAEAPDLAPPPGAVALSLDEAVRLALARNPGVAIAAAEAERAANDVTRGNAGFLPTVDAGGALTGSRSGGFGGGSDSTSSVRGVTSLGADVALSYTIFDGFRRDATYRRLQAQALQFALLAGADAEATALAVTEAYLDVVRQEGLAAARAEAVALSEDRLAIEDAEVRIGTGAEIDAALALSDLNADRAALLRQALALAQARAALGALLALPDPTAVAVTDTLALGPPPPVEALIAEIDADNRRVLALRASEAAAREVVREARAAYLPTVRASAGVGLTAVDRGFFPPQADPVIGPELRYGVTVSLPIFDAGERRRQVGNAQIRVRQAELAIEDEVLALRADAAALAASVRTYRQLAALEAQSRAIARENVRVALAQFRLGFITPVDLRQVQLSLVDAETRLVDAVYLARLAEARLRLLAGDLLPAGYEPPPPVLD